MLHYWLGQILGASKLSELQTFLHVVIRVQSSQAGSQSLLEL